MLYKKVTQYTILSQMSLYSLMFIVVMVISAPQPLQVSKGAYETFKQFEQR